MTSRSVISLFTGAGGLDYGFEAAGFETRVCVDLDHDACETLRRNRKWMVCEGPIESFPSARLLFHAGVGPGEAAVLVGGPPCQPFSKSGYWADGDVKRMRDPRAATITNFLRVLEDALPQVVVFENVAGFAFKGKDDGLRYLSDGIEAINARQGTSYSPVMSVLQAAEYGVPQVRERFFLVAERSGHVFRFPSRHAAPARTAWDALADVKPESGEQLHVKGRWADLLPSIPEGSNYLWHTERGGGLPLFGWRRRYWTFLLKLAKNRPSWTIQAQPGPAVGPFHWDNRRLSRRELARLQTFPDSVEVFGGHGSAQKQIGNAVPSLLAEVIARSVREQLFDDPARGPLKRLPPDRSPAPPPRPHDPVPASYIDLAGDHAPHPGTGLGYRSSALRASRPDMPLQPPTPPSPPLTHAPAATLPPTDHTEATT